MRHPPIAVVFDLDGTLVDTAEDIAFSVNYMRQKYGFAPIDTPTVLKAVGRGAEFLIQNTLETRTFDRHRELLEEYRAHYRDHQGERSKPYAGIDEALTTLFGIADLYVLSNKPVDATLREIEIAGLSHHFKAVWGGGSFEHLKPDPIGIHTAAAHSGADTSNTVMVGDLFVDLETAARAGVPSLFVTWGFGTLADVRHSPTKTIHTTAELPAAVEAVIQQTVRVGEHLED